MLSPCVVNLLHGGSSLVHERRLRRSGGVERITQLGADDGSTHSSFGNMIEMDIIDPMRVTRAALQNGASVAGLLLTTNSLVAEEQTPWGGDHAPMTEFGSLDEGLKQPSPVDRYPL